MIKTTYFCDCCKAMIPDDSPHIMMIPKPVGSVSEEPYPGYGQMSDAHFCRACTDKIISFMFTPVDIEAMKKDIDESNAIIDTLHAELEEARKALEERTAEQPAEESAIDPADPPAPATANVKQRMTGKRSPVDKQQVIRLYRDGYMTYQQIADRVGCSVTTVYSIVRKYNKTAPAPDTEPAQAEEATD